MFSDRPRNAPPAELGRLNDVMMAAKPCSGLEVSLLLDQEKNKSIHLNSPAIVQPTKESTGKNMQRQEQQSELPESNQVKESYNTWKARNAHALHDVTGRTLSTKQVLRSPKVNEVRRPHTTNNEHFYSQRPQTAISSPTVASQVPHNIYGNHGHKPSLELYPRIDENLSHCNIDRQNTDCRRDDKYNYENYSRTNENNINLVNKPNIETPRIDESVTHCNFSKQNTHRHKYNHENYSRTNENCPCPEFHCSPKQSQNRVPKHPSSTNMHSKDKDFQIHKVYPQCNSYNLKSSSCSRNIPEPQSPNYSENGCNQEQCQCGRGKVGNNSTNGMELASRNIPFTAIAAPLNLDHLNQSIVNLYNMIHLQHEELFRLKQEVMQNRLDCERFSKEKVACHQCSCEHKNNQTVKANFSNSNNSKSESVQTVTHLDERKSRSLRTADRPKCTAGVTTSLTEESDDSSPTSPEKPKTITQTTGLTNKKPKRKIAEKKYKSPPHYQKLPNERKLIREKKRREKTKGVPSPVKKTSNAGFQSRSQDVGKSFSLNEFECGVRPEEEDDDDDDASSNTSTQIDMPNYIDFNGTATSESSSDADEREESDSATEESSDPQLGWTYYNGVVEQVNKILHKKQSPSKRDKAQLPKRTPASHMYQAGNTDYETGNNWSKRVTFDGPSPLDDRDSIPNMAQVSWLHQAGPTPHYRANGGAARMQDFMMFNIADGNTNHSFSTLRYLERYNLPTSSPKDPEIPEYLFQEYKKSNKSKKKNKSKPPNPDMFPQMHQSHNRRKKY
uniref:Uncharacterized protein n=1 Tax=Graphocephala atropunctata TaxID=36148 RepID=A0A1B6MR92_9HEMI